MAPRSMESRSQSMRTLRLSLGAAPALRITCRHRQLRTYEGRPMAGNNHSRGYGCRILWAPHYAAPGAVRHRISLAQPPGPILRRGYGVRRRAEYAKQGGLAVSALRTAALYPAAVRIAPPSLCHPGSEWRMLCVEVSGHGLGVAVYHYRAVLYMTAVAVAWEAVVELDALAYCYGPAPSTATDPTSLPRHSARGICAHPEACAPLACSWIAQTLNGLRSQRYVRHLYAIA
uniref:Uncharacterized protein n=1 Tax=Tremblaya princeps TaxID=189385 RepID=Q8KTR1_TREPR|nr:unknown [Candidatus Tremblaya princeps]